MTSHAKTDEARALVDERRFLQMSLADLERERAAGDVDERDYELLRARYASSLRATELALHEADAAIAPLRVSPLRRMRIFLGRRSVRRVLAIAAASCFAAGVVILALSLSGVRLPGEQLSGSVSVPPSAAIEEELARAAVLGNSGQLQSALELYDSVLATVPNQPVALCYRGWLERLSGLASHDRSIVTLGDASLRKAVSVDPGYPDARALDAVALYEDSGDVHGAIGEFNALVRDHPTSALVKAVRKDAIAVYGAAGDPLPRVFRAAA